VRIACLHTAESNVGVFEATLAGMNIAALSLTHKVRPDLLAAAQQYGGLNAEIERQTVMALAELSLAADAVLLTCSTLGPCVKAERIGPVPVVRVDSALAREATSAGGRVIVLCAVETTLGPTARIFQDAAETSGAAVEIRLVQGAWPLFMAGELARYLETIAAAAQQAYDEGANVVALAQASMAEARELVGASPKPLCSPASGLLAAVRAVSRGSAQR